MKPEKNKLKIQRLVSILIAIVGLVLMIYMVTMESEPGALPLLLIISGTGWYIVTRYKLRKQTQ